MSERLADDCSKCPLLERVAALEKLVAGLLEKVDRQQEVIRNQQEEIARLRRHSGNSSKPPSSDIVKPPKSKLPGGKRRRIGGQPGHEKHERKPFPPEEIDETKTLSLERCPDCGGALILDRKIEPKVQQTVELPEKPAIVTEYRRPGFYCAHCKTAHFSPLPEGVVEGQLFGRRLAALTAYLKGSFFASYTRLEHLFREVFGLSISRGHLARTVLRTSEALSVPYEALRAQVSQAEVLGVDETGFKENGKKRWIWTFVTKLWSFFRVADTRGRKELLAVVDKTFSGTLVADFFSVYTGLENIRRQHCLAHLIRDILFLTELPGESDKLCGQKLSAAFRRIFEVWHRRETLAKKTFDHEIYLARVQIRKAISMKGLGKKAQTLAVRIQTCWNEIFLFLSRDNVPPTNNESERAVRLPAMSRRLSQGVRGENGKRWSERIWTVLDTCVKQTRSSWNFIIDALKAHQTGSAYPALAP